MPQPMLQTYRVIKSKGISVTLDGHGSDELFSGYGHIHHALSDSKTLAEFNEIIEIDKSTRSGIFSLKEKKSMLDSLKLRIKYLLSRLGYYPSNGLRNNALLEPSDEFSFQLYDAKVSYLNAMLSSVWMHSVRFFMRYFTSLYFRLCFVITIDIQWQVGLKYECLLWIGA